MSKTRPFSIYLLKSGFDATNTLVQDHDLEKTTSSALPAGSAIFILDKQPTYPWWRSYFQLDLEIKQAGKGALGFLPVGQRYFALSFGHVYYNLKDQAYEHDFGLKVTLNCIEPKELKSTDTLEPGAARRQLTQLPVGSDLTYFDFDQDSAILKSLTGKVLDVHKNLFSSVTGSSSLVIKSEVPIEGLVSFCEKLLVLYDKNDYRTTFPEIENIVPIRDPGKIDELNNKLIEGLRQKSPNLYLTIPDIIDYRHVGYFAEFSGEGRSMRYPDVFLGKYYEYLESNGTSVDNLDFVQLSAHKLKLTDGDGKVQKSYSVAKCLIFDTALDDGKQTFHRQDDRHGDADCLANGQFGS